MATFNKKNKEQIQPKVEHLFKEFNKVLKANGLSKFKVGEIKIKNTGEKLDCPCGTERIMLPSGKIVERCKKCPPPPGA